MPLTQSWEVLEPGFPPGLAGSQASKAVPLGLREAENVGAPLGVGEGKRLLWQEQAAKERKGRFSSVVYPCLCLLTGPVQAPP